MELRQIEGNDAGTRKSLLRLLEVAPSLGSAGEQFTRFTQFIAGLEGEDADQAFHRVCGRSIYLSGFFVEIVSFEAEGPQPLKNKAAHPINGTGREAEALFIQLELEPEQQLAGETSIASPEGRPEHVAIGGEKAQTRVLGELGQDPLHVGSRAEQAGDEAITPGIAVAAELGVIPPPFALLGVDFQNELVGLE